MMAITKRRLLDHSEITDHEKKNLSILDTIRRRGPITRAEISRLIGLNIVTVTSYVDQYIKKGAIKEVGIDVSSGGRKPTLVDLNPEAAYAIGVGLNAVDMIAILCNLKGESVSVVKQDRPLQAGEALIESMVGLVQQLLQKTQIASEKIHGIGIGIPGVFNRETNSVRWPTGLLKDDLSITVSIHSIFEEKFGLATLVDNDANAAVFGEEWYGQGLGVKNAVYLCSDSSCGLMVNGQIYRGTTGCAGEWGGVPGDSNNVPSLVESYKAGLWVRDLGIALKAQAQEKKNPQSKIYSLVGGDLKKITMFTVVKAAQEGDDFAQQLLREAGYQLGLKAATLINLFNPELLIIGGGIELGKAPIMDAVRDAIKEKSVPEAVEKLRILPSQLGENGVAMGAAALVSQNFFVNV